MSESRELSFPGGLAYTGHNAYAYAYSGNNAYAYSAPGDAGIGGFAADPMLSAAIVSTRDALLADVDLPMLGKGGDRRDGKAFPRTNGNTMLLPTPNIAADIATYGTQVRASMALFDLLSSVRFSFTDAEVANLEGSCVVNEVDAWRPLATMKRPNRAYFEGQLRLVDSWASRRDVRAAEILTQVAPPLGYFASLLNMQAGRHRRSLELVNAALQFTYAVCMQFKHALACPRPGEYSVGMQAMIEVPMHSSLPAGHAAEGHVTAAVLGALAGAPQDSKTDAMLRRLAYRIAQNRVVAGLHFPVDLIAGRLLGDALASYFLARCGRKVGDALQWTGGKFEIDAPDENKGGADEFEAADANPARVRFFGPGCGVIETQGARESALLVEMWNEAAAEWTLPPEPAIP